MAQVSSIITWLIPAISVLSLIIFGWVLRRLGQPAQPDPAQQALLNRLKTTNAELLAAVATDRGIIMLIGALPVDVHPVEAEHVLVELTPGRTQQDRYRLMLHGWESEKSPQALAALAGMALVDPDGTQAEFLGKALDEGAPALVDHIMTELLARQDELAQWLRRGRLRSELGRAAKRIFSADPEVADRVAKGIVSIEPRLRELMMAELRTRIDDWADKKPARPGAMIQDLVLYCLPLYPELAAAAHEALGRHIGPDWQRVHLQFDSAVLHRFYDREGLAGFDMDAALGRLCDGIMSPDAAFSELTANGAADLLHDYFYDDPEYRLLLRRALDWAEEAHGVSSGYEWLAAELQPPADMEARLAEVRSNADLYETINEAVKALAETTSTLDPGIALVELRNLLPHVPVDVLRVSLVARWKKAHEVICLTALCGLVLELTESVEQDGVLIGPCLHWPLRHGPLPVIERLIPILEERFDGFDSWIATEESILDLAAAAGRFGADEPGVAAARLLDRVRQRRSILLDRMIAERLQRAVDEGDSTEPFELVLDLYRLCLPEAGHLAAPVRNFIAERSTQTDWRRAMLYLESMSLSHFAAIGEESGYDFDHLQAVLSAAMRDNEVEVASLAASLAAQLVERGLVTRIIDLAALESDLAWSANLFPARTEKLCRIGAGRCRCHAAREHGLTSGSEHADPTPPRICVPGHLRLPRQIL